MYPLWASHVAAAAVQFTEDRTAELIKLTPVYVRFLNDAKLNAVMARKNLLIASVRQPLADKTVALAQVARATKAALTTGEPVPQALKELAEPHGFDALAGADHALAAAKTALAVIAGCSIVFDGGPRQVEDAKKLTERSRPDVPKALWTALLRIAEGTGAIAAKSDAD